MLLPSDIARLVLGYLQQEGLRATTRAFILESSNLKEYAEHSTDDGAIPACVFSLFGKNLTTILNEYVAVKAKESCHETQVPAMMTSLWKKLDFTLNQIKSMQNSPAVYQNQRLRTRNGIMNMRGQRSLSSCTRSPSTALLAVPPPSTHYDASPLATPQGMLGHSTPVCYSSLQTRPSQLCVSQPQIQDVGRLVINMNRESPLHIVVPDRRINSGPLSPGRRKCDSPRRRGGGLCGLSGTTRTAAPSSGPVPDQQNEALQEGVAENFPQMVIENAREKILNDKSLQEKLAENINKILGSDINPQSSKQVACSTVVPDQSIDEILGLQGEIHMSDDAIQDILEQTESDPAFQALFDLFDCGKNKDSEGESQFDTSLSNTTQESDEADSSSQTRDPGTSQEEPTSGAETSSRILRTRSAQDHKSKKTRKTAHLASNALKSGPALGKRGNPHTKAGATETVAVAGSDGKSDSAQSKAQSSIGKDSVSTAAQGMPSSVLAEEDDDMEVAEATETAVLLASPVQPLAVQTDHQESPQASKESGGENASLSMNNRASVSVSTAAGAQKPPGTDPCARSAGAPEAVVPQFDGSAETPGSQPHLSPSPSQPVSQHRTVQLNAAGSTHSPTCPVGQKPNSVAVPLGTALPEAPSILAHSTCAPSTPFKEPDPSKIVSLKIIVSDEADDQSSDLALSQAVSSITGERLPTIILSSPAKSPAKASAGAVCSITQEETVQAVCCLQGADLNPLLTGKIGEAVMGLPARGVEEGVQLSVGGDLPQEAGYIQLVPGAASYGSSSSYFVVADPAAVSQQSKLMVLPGCPSLGQASPASHMLTTPPRPVISVAQDVSQAYSPGSTLFISSPSQPMLQSMMVPVSVVGQSSVGKFTVVQNQLLQVTAPGVKTPAKGKQKPKLAPKDRAVSGKASATDKSTKTLDPNPQCLPAALKPLTVRTADSSQPSETAGPQQQQQPPPERTSAGHAPAPSSSPRPHRRVLCFDVSAENPDPAPAEEKPSPPPEGPACTPAAPVPASCGQEPQKETPSGQSPGSCKLRAIQPAILRGSRTTDGKMRPEAAAKVADKKKPSEAPKESEKRAAEPSQSLSRSASEQETRTQSTSGRRDAALPEPAKRRSECRRKSHQLEKKDDEGSASTHGVKYVAPGNRTTTKSAGSKKLAEERSRAEKGEGAQKCKEAWPERRGSSHPPLHVTANKENEVEPGRSEQPPASAAPQETRLPPPAVGSAAPAAQGGSGRAPPSMTSPLTKQAAEMLQDIQGHNPAATPTKRSSGLGCPGLPLPRTPGSGCYPEEPPDALRTPVRQRPGRDGDGTPRHLPPPATPDIPTCSPASEAGSESSINMAAHTLMILSRAAIARTGTPLKDSVRQQGAPAPAVTPKGKKRKPAEPLASPTSKKETQHGGSAAAKKAKKQKKMLDSFPDNLDVDKFLSSLHYDE
ncbi:LOW QUALITY PROTEIN: protein NPAT-like [Anguilla anguilla]|uniref:LOW QUALITY PROTEIN: protein NPAT-like n=1 Tax=Anguilla anguilla TaxID=7936 RepID=UPI0015A79C0B|nr:LOW QUALITY PROTEIN: protein NPAT-like [Anguilla anguilla]